MGAEPGEAYLSRRAAAGARRGRRARAARGRRGAGGASAASTIAGGDLVARAGADASRSPWSAGRTRRASSSAATARGRATCVGVTGDARRRGGRAWPCSRAARRAARARRALPAAAAAARRGPRAGARRRERDARPLRRAGARTPAGWPRRAACGSSSTRRRCRSRRAWREVARALGRRRRPSSPRPAARTTSCASACRPAARAAAEAAGAHVDRRASTAGEPGVEWRGAPPGADAWRGFEH